MYYKPVTNPSQNPWKKPAKTRTRLLRVRVLQGYKFTYPDPYPRDPYPWPWRVSKPVVFPRTLWREDCSFCCINFFNFGMLIHLWFRNIWALLEMKLLENVCEDKILILCLLCWVCKLSYLILEIIQNTAWEAIEEQNITCRHFSTEESKIMRVGCWKL